MPVSKCSERPDHFFFKMRSIPEDPCAWCSYVPRRFGAVEYNGIMICRDCIAEAAGTCAILRTSYEAIERWVRATYQDEFLEFILTVRDPPPELGEGDKVSISVTTTRYMRDRAQALAEEANISLSAWVRQAIFHAFKLTERKP